MDKSIEIVYSGEDYFKRLHGIISNSNKEIHFQTYIFENDSTGIYIAEALKAAAARKVKIYLLLDGYGSSSLPNKFINDLKKHGVEVRIFSPLFSVNSLYIGRRLHHKIVVADEQVALIGGINIGDRYRGKANETAWLDYAIEIRNPKIAKAVSNICQHIYLKKLKTKSAPIIYEEDGTSIHIIQNDWLKRRNEISNAYIKAIKEAKEEIIIVGSYFLPGRKLINALRKAAHKGVKIKLILSGIADVPLIKRATSYLYLSLLKHNIELYEWNKSVLHGKVAVVDAQKSIIGSFNLNHLSSYGSIEMNVEIESSEFSKNLTAHFNDEILIQCERITSETIKKRTSFLTNTLNWIAYHFVRIILMLATYLPQKRFKKLY